MIHKGCKYVNLKNENEEELPTCLNYEEWIGILLEQMSFQLGMACKRTWANTHGGYLSLVHFSP